MNGQDQTGRDPSAARYSTRRHKRHHSEHATSSDLSNRWLWLGSLAVVAVYLGALGYTYLRRPPAPPAPSPSPAPAPVAAPADGGKAAEPMAALISKWKKAAKTRREADSFQNEGRIDRALGRLKEGLVLDPQMLELKIAAARIHVQQKEYATACDLLIDVVAADPSNDSAKIALASALSGLQQHEDALEVARWVIEGDAYNEQALRIAAAASLDVGRPGEAIGHLRRVVSVNPTDVSARNSLGMAYMKSLDFVKAAEAFAEILQGDPGNSAALYNLAVCYARQGMTDNAIAVLETAAEQFGESFVLAWTKTQDFSGLEGAAGFRSLQQRLDKSAGKPAPPSSP